MLYPCINNTSMKNEIYPLTYYDENFLSPFYGLLDLDHIRTSISKRCESCLCFVSVVLNFFNINSC